MAAGAKRRSKLDKPKTAALIVGWVSDGKSDAEVATLLARRRTKTTRQAVTKFRARHQEEIAAITQAAAAGLRDVAIADKQERMRILQELMDRSLEVVRERGMMAREPKWVTVYAASPDPPKSKKGEPLPAKQDRDGMFLEKLGEKVLEVERFDAPLANTIVGIEKAAAEELGELPQRGALSDVPPQWTQINVTVVNDNRKVKIDRRDRVIEN